MVRRGHRAARVLLQARPSSACSASRCPRSTAARASTSFKYQRDRDRGDSPGPAVRFGGSGVHVALCLPYLLKLGTDEQKKRWLPEFITGEMMFAIAMTEPGTGSDLAGMRTTAKLSEDGSALRPQRRQDVHHRRRARRPGDRLRPHRAAAARTTAATASRCSSSTPSLDGYAVGRKLDKIGLRVSDTAELSFTDVKVPVEDLLGEENKGFSYLGPEPAAGAARPSPTAPTRRPPPRWSSPSSTPRSGTSSASRSPRSRTPSSSWPPARPRSTPRRRSPTGRWRHTTRAS